MRKILATIVTLTVIATACSGGTTATEQPTPGDDPVNLDNNEIRLLAGLVPFQSCDDLLGHLQDEARERVGPYGLDYFGYGGGFGRDVIALEEGGFATGDGAADFATSEPAPADAPTAARLDSSGGENFQKVSGDLDDSGGSTDFTGTNVQELGVDEPDIIKTDGDRIILISETTLTYVDISGPEPVVTDQITIPEGWGHELFFQGDRALLFTNGGNWGYPTPVGPPIAEFSDDVDFGAGEDAEASFAEEAPAAPPADGDIAKPIQETELVEPDPDFPAPTPEPDFEPLPEPDFREPIWYGPSAAILELDLSDPSDLEITSTLRIQGEYLSARRVGNTVRLALTTPPSQLQWVYPSSQAGEDRAERFNRELIDETTITDWIPEFELETRNGTSTGQLLACDRLHRPSDFAGFDIVSVLSFDLSDGLDSGDGAGVLASGRTVYASADRFYVATTAWVGEEVVRSDGFAEWEETYSTDVHAFSISTEAPAEYVASGMVPGSLLNQFSMDEHDGYLRIITTDGSPWSERQRSETKLTVLSEDGDVLAQVGQVGGLGKGEQLFSARLLDDIGFAVTFRQIDPFYVLDLSDPTDPRVTGELKIPGFSTYLHPVSDELVLGVGQDATEQGGTLGLKVSLFDVSDVTDPREVATWVMSNSNSPAEHDHRAFQFIQDEGIAIVPVQSWNGDFNGAVMLKIGDQTITEVGRVTHVPESSTPTTDCRVLTSDDFPENSELFWMTQEGHVQYCDENDNGGYGGWSCEVIPLADLRYWAGETDTTTDLVDELAGGTPGPEDRIELCWSNGGNYQQQIQRSLVVGNDLWTMSWAQLQANNLDSLDVESVIGL